MTVSTFNWFISGIARHKLEMITFTGSVQKKDEVMNNQPRNTTHVTYMSISGTYTKCL